MKNSEIIKQIIKSLEENHINLYHNVTKSTIFKYIKSIKNLDNLSSIQFDRELLKIFALFKDAHTGYRVKWIPLDHSLTFLNDKFYIFFNNKWEEVAYFGDFSVKTFYQNIKSLINYETQAWLNHEINEKVNNGYIYKILDINEKETLLIKLKNKEQVVIKIGESKLIKKQKPYYYKVLDNNILYVKYFRCVENANYLFKDFVKDISNEIEEKGITNYILDVRGNTGGNSEILNPFQKLVKDKNLKGVMLIDNGVFSSGRFVVARFKKDFSISLIGEPTGGAVKSYGYSKILNVDNINFSVSTRFWDFSDIFGYDGSIMPDIYVPLTIKDIENQKDIQLEEAIKFIGKGLIKKEDLQNDYIK